MPLTNKQKKSLKKFSEENEKARSKKKEIKFTPPLKKINHDS
jgi:hypothetical protein